VSIEDAQRADASLLVLAGLECDFEGGLIGRDGHCSLPNHAHCPFCGEWLGCPHEVAVWDDSDGYRGPEFPTRPEFADSTPAPSDESIRAMLGDLAPLWEVYADKDSMLFGTELFETAADILSLPIVEVEWEQLDSRVSSAGATYFARNARDVVGALDGVSRRVQAVFERVRQPAYAAEQAFSGGNGR
jgi:hypothetical protein